MAADLDPDFQALVTAAIAEVLRAVELQAGRDAAIRALAVALAHYVSDAEPVRQSGR